MISPSGSVSTLAGTAGVSATTDATGPAASFKSPRAVAISPGGIAYVADFLSSYDSTVRKISPLGEVTTLAGAPGTLPLAETLYFLNGVAVDSTGNVFATDFTSIRKITPEGVVSIFSGQKRSVTVVGSSTIMSWPVGTKDGTASVANFNNPGGLAIDTNGNLYVTETSGCVIRKVTSTGQATTLAGLTANNKGVSGTTDGTGSAARFNAPRGIAVDAQRFLYIADTGSHTIRKMSPTGVVTTIGGLPGYAGSGEGTGDRAVFNQPMGIAVDSSGIVYVADTLNHRIVKGVPQSAPAILVENSSGTYFQPGSPPVNLGSTPPGTTAPAAILTVKNLGNSPLVISGLAISGPDAANFTLDRSSLADSIPASGSGILRVLFTPVGQEPNTAKLTIFNNDPEMMSFEINLTGMGNLPPVLPPYAVSAQAGNTSISLVKLLATAYDPDGDAITVTGVSWPSTHSGQVVLKSDSILYTAPLFVFSGVETFLVTLTDARGAIASGQVNVTKLDARNHWNPRANLPFSRCKRHPSAHLQPPPRPRLIKTLRDCQSPPILQNPPHESQKSSHHRRRKVPAHPPPPDAR